MVRLIIALTLLFVTHSLNAEPIPGIGPIGEIQKLHTGLMFTEGPTQAPDGTIYFTDIPADRIYQIAKTGELSVFLEPAGHCNGLMVTGDGTLYACSMDGQLISIDRKTKKVTPLAPTYMSKRFNAPNDLVVDKSGGIYFTDPHFRAPEPLPQGTTAVYYRAADGEVTRLTAPNPPIVTPDGILIKQMEQLKAPNGVILSPDEKTLYIIPSMQEEMMAYPVEAPGKLGRGKVFCKLKQPDGQEGRGGDGLTIDTQGNLYITSGLGLQVYNPEGKLLGIIELPEQPANVTFGGPKNDTLYVTARTSVYSVKTEATGHRFPGK